MPKQKKNKINYLDLVFKHNDKFRYETNEKGEVTIFVENKGVFNFIMQKLMKKPRFSQVHLEEFGSYIWPLVDGVKTVEQIGAEVKEHFGEKAEPLYPRLVQYFRMLTQYEFVIKA